MSSHLKTRNGVIDWDRVVRVFDHDQETRQATVEYVDEHGEKRFTIAEGVVLEATDVRIDGFVLGGFKLTQPGSH